MKLQLLVAKNGNGTEEQAVVAGRAEKPPSKQWNGKPRREGRTVVSGGRRRELYR
jgi:hypothetical protein